MAADPHTLNDPVRLTRSVDETAGILGISPRSLRKRIYKGDVRVTRIGERVLIPVSEIERILTPAPYAEGGSDDR